MKRLKAKPAFVLAIFICCLALKLARRPSLICDAKGKLNKTTAGRMTMAFAILFKTTP